MPNPQREREILLSMLGRNALGQLDAAIALEFETRDRLQVLAAIGAPRDWSERETWIAAKGWLQEKLGVPGADAWGLEGTYAHLDRDAPDLALIDRVWTFLLVHVEEYGDEEDRRGGIEHIPVIEPAPAIPAPEAPAPEAPPPRPVAFDPHTYPALPDGSFGPLPSQHINRLIDAGRLPANRQFDDLRPPRMKEY